MVVRMGEMLIVAVKGGEAENVDTVLPNELGEEVKEASEPIGS